MRAFPPALIERIRRTDSDVHPILELASVRHSHIRQDTDAWDEADNTVGLTKHTNGELALEAGETDIINQTVQNDWITDLDTTGSFDVARIEWGNPNQTIREIRARLHPKRTAAAKEVAEFGCQVFRLHAVHYPGTVDESLELLPITGLARVGALGTTPTDFSFMFDQHGRLPRVGPAPIAGPQAYGFTKPTTFVFFYAFTSTGQDAGNVGLGYDTASSVHTTGLNKLYGQRLLSRADGRYTLGTALDVPTMTVRQGTYTAATITWTANLFDLGATPSAAVELKALVVRPPGTSVTLEVDDDTTTPFTGGQRTFVDGDLVGVDNTPTGGNDLSTLTPQQRYAIRVTLTPDANGRETPRLLAVGVTDLIRLTLAEEVRMVDGRWQIDAPTLIGQVAKVLAEIIRDGELDYDDHITAFLTGHDLGDVEARLFWGRRDLARPEWGLVDVFLIEDYTTAPGAVTLELVSALILVRGVFPVAKDVGGNVEREPYVQSGVAIKSVWKDIIGNEMQLPGRWIGSPPEDLTTVSNIVRDSDAKVHLDALARLAIDGYANISSQGRIKAVPFDGTSAITHIFAPEEVTPRQIVPGFKYRAPEYFVPYDWVEDENRFDNEHRSYDADSIIALGRGHVPDIGTEPDDVSQWIDTQGHAQAIGDRQVRWFGTGLPIWVFESAVRYPELEQGDRVAVPTTQFVARDPKTARALKGHLWALGTIVSVDASARLFGVWIQSYAHIFPLGESVTRNKPPPPTDAFFHVQNSIHREIGASNVFVTIWWNEPTTMQWARAEVEASMAAAGPWDIHHDVLPGEQQVRFRWPVEEAQGPYFRVRLIDVFGRPTAWVTPAAFAAIPPPQTEITSNVDVYYKARNTDPANPPTNQRITWQSDGGASGEDGDWMAKVTDSGGITKLFTLLDFDARHYVKDYGAAGTGAVQAAIDAAFTAGGGVVEIPLGTYVCDPIVLKSNVHLIGHGWGSVLMLADGANADFITLATVSTERTGLHNLTVDGNKANQATGHAIHYINSGGTFTDGDSLHRIGNVRIVEAKLSGLKMDFGVREAYVTGVYIQRADLYGFDLRCTDSVFVGCTSGAAGEYGWWAGCPNSRLVGCKAFGSGRILSDRDGFYVNQQRIVLSACEAQDNQQHGFHLEGCHRSILSGCMADSNGRNLVTGVGFRLNNADYCQITGVATDRQAAPTQTHPLDVTGNTQGCVINLTTTGHKTSENPAGADADFQLIVLNNLLRVPSFDDPGRPAQTKGAIIFNTSDGQLNIGNGATWTLPDGTAT